MRILLNGSEHEAPDNATVAELIERLGLGDSACAAEVNRELVPRRDQPRRVLAEGDRVELVTLVGGG
jgi:sulfur carrier protein